GKGAGMEVREGDAGGVCGAWDGRAMPHAQPSRDEVIPGDAFDHAASGSASEVPFRREMERAFGADFGAVRAYLGGEPARVGLAALGARAATHGDRVAFADPTPSRTLVAHELAHVVQQRAGGGGAQAKQADVSALDDTAEQRADAAAHAIERGESVPDVGTAPSGRIHRNPIETNGGTFRTEGYRAWTNPNAGRPRAEAEIWLYFMPKAPV